MCDLSFFGCKIGDIARVYINGAVVEAMLIDVETMMMKFPWGVGSVKIKSVVSVYRKRENGLTLLFGTQQRMMYNL